MNASAMDRRIIIQNAVISRDEAGGVAETWGEQYSVWSEIPKQQGGETLIADGDRASDIRQFRIRYRAGLSTTTHRISYQDRIYDIRHIAEEGRKNRQLLTAVWNQSIT